ncbi:MAG: hypothetical protein QGI86_23815 [Candidatus Poribacteria bacterium]|nr:hypothetical protein [Candidatus Poribacteria bacterium]MDP6747337.1 hypothetical protein [Candidatus Poribacteria bacterium]
MAVAPIAPTDQQGRTQMVFTAGSAGLRIIKARVGEMMLSSSVAVIYTGPTVEVEAPKGEKVPTEQPTDEPADEPVEEPVKEPVKPSRPVTVRPAQFKISLKTGLNMTSLPVQPDQPVSAKTLARDLAATVILRLDADSQKFIPFVPEHFEETNFEIEGGMGIIVNVKEAKEHTFSGQAWDNVPAAGIDSNDRQPVWAFSLLFGGAGLEVDWRQNQLTVTNLSRGSRYGIQLDHNRPVGVATVVDSTQQAVIQVGDLIQVRLDQQRWRYRVSDRDLANASPT